MEGCWAEDPTERPDFGHIKIYMAKLNKYVQHVFSFKWLIYFQKPLETAEISLINVTTVMCLTLF